MAEPIISSGSDVSDRMRIRRGAALLSYILSEGTDLMENTIEIYLGNRPLTPSEWYVTNGKLIIELENK
jgi:hypothetical protein